MINGTYTKMWYSPYQNYIMDFYGFVLYNHYMSFNNNNNLISNGILGGNEDNQYTNTSAQIYYRNYGIVLHAIFQKDLHMQVV